jgi:hypothetical protein
MSKDKLNVKLLFKREQVQKEGNFISRLHVHLETREGFLRLVFLFNVW